MAVGRGPGHSNGQLGHPLLCDWGLHPSVLKLTTDSRITPRVLGGGGGLNCWTTQDKHFLQANTSEELVSSGSSTMTGKG